MAWWEKPIRGGVRKVLNVATNIYFSKIEVRGLKNLQTAGTKTGAIFAGNHPSGLVDPMVIMSAVNLPMSSIAKHSLFSTPIISTFVRAMKAVPVMQPYDPGLPPDQQATAEERKTMNEQMFSTVQQRLVDEGFNIVIFPEGTCHSTPQIKQMRMGTARMTLQIAASGGPRIPVIPVGLSYSVPSGASFRAKVLVDFGKPIEVTDEMLARYTSGDPEEKLLVEEKLMKRVERHLRHVTIRVPDWTVLLSEFCKKEARGPPVYSLLENEGKDDSVFHVPGGKTRGKLKQRIEEATALTTTRKQQVSVRIGRGGGGDNSNHHHHHHHHHHNGQEQPIFYSRVEQESSNDARKRKKAKETAVAYTPAVPQVLQRQAARNAFFSIQGFDNAPRDWELLNMIHICRSLYIETSKNVTLAQYASLTRNFMRVVLERLSDPMVQKLWKELREYRQKLDELGVTDKYIRKFVKFDLDQDGDVTVKEQMRSELSLVLQQNRLELAKQAVLVPLGVIGNVIHAPVIILSKYLGVKMGVSDTRDGGAPSDNESMDGKDLSVVATMEMLGGLVGLAMLYPSIAVATMVLTPLSPLVTVSCVAMSGYAMALGQPVEVFVRNIKAAQKMHSSKHSTQLISDLKQRREDLQRGLRSFADLHAPDDMKGWWRDPESYVQGLKLQQIEAERQWLSRHQRVTPDLIEAANLNVFTIPLKRNLRHPLERAVLTSKTEPGNTKALFWLSGRNDAFYHIHILDRLLATGFDLYALDLRRCGRAKYDTSGTEVTPELYAHDTFDFGEYNEEIDAVLKFLKNPGRLPANQVVHEGGCGKVYDSIVCYAHSTGGLVAASYGARGSKNSGAWRGAIDGYIFNSPFLEFNLPWYQNGLVQHADLVDPERIISQGGADSLYSRKLYQNYGFHVPEHKSLKELHVTAGWLAAVTDVQKNLVQGKLRLPPNKPTLVLSTSADEVLSQEHIQQRIPFLSADPNEEKQPIDKAIWENGVVERRIGTDDKNQSAHDVLAASPSRVAEAMNHIDRWLGVNFP
jgi:1-acyl-sn-glycerol-3-phosphate acyltransferase